MLILPPSVRIYLCAQPTDMRRSFDRLAEMTRTTIGENPLSGHLFVFRSRGGDKVKILWWDRGGYCLWYKRLERGVFRFPDDSEIRSGDLTLILEGIDLSGARRRKVFEPRTDSAVNGTRHPETECFRAGHRE